MLLFGREDKPTTAERCQLAMAQFPKLRLSLLDGCAHMVHWDYADLFVREAIAFARAGVVAV